MEKVSPATTNAVISFLESNGAPENRNPTPKPKTRNRNPKPKPETQTRNPEPKPEALNPKLKPEPRNPAAGVPLSRASKTRTVASTVSHLLARTCARLWEHEELAPEDIPQVR